MYPRDEGPARAVLKQVLAHGLGSVERHLRRCGTARGPGRSPPHGPPSGARRSEGKADASCLTVPPRALVARRENGTHLSSRSPVGRSSLGGKMGRIFPHGPPSGARRSGGKWDASFLTVPRRALVARRENGTHLSSRSPVGRSSLGGKMGRIFPHGPPSGARRSEGKWDASFLTVPRRALVARGENGTHLSSRSPVGRSSLGGKMGRIFPHGPPSGARRSEGKWD